MDWPWQASDNGWHEFFHRVINLTNGLNNEGVRYLLIGGYAVGYYGYPRATADMDVWVAVDTVNADKLVNVLKNFGMDSPDITAALFLEKGNVIRIGFPPMRLEIQTDISGVDFDSCFSRRRRINTGDFDISLIGLKDLKKNKLASGRHKDLDDLEHLP